MRNPRNPTNSPMIRPKLTEDQVCEIRKIYRYARKVANRTGKKQSRAGLSRELAERYGVAIRTIQHIKKGDRWRGLK